MKNKRNKKMCQWVSLLTVGVLSAACGTETDHSSNQTDTQQNKPSTTNVPGTAANSSSTPLSSASGDVGKRVSQSTPSGGGNSPSPNSEDGKKASSEKNKEVEALLAFGNEHTTQKINEKAKKLESSDEAALAKKAGEIARGTPESKKNVEKGLNAQENKETIARVVVSLEVLYDYMNRAERLENISGEDKNKVQGVFKMLREAALKSIGKGDVIQHNTLWQLSNAINFFTLW